VQVRNTDCGVKSGGRAVGQEGSTPRIWKASLYLVAVLLTALTLAACGDDDDGGNGGGGGGGAAAELDLQTEGQLTIGAEFQ
jgi:hypothetical protein